MAWSSNNRTHFRDLRIRQVMTTELIFHPPHKKKVTHRYFHRWFFFIIPINSQNRIPPMSRWGHPDLLYGTGPFNISKNNGRIRWYYKIGVYFPSQAPITCCMWSAAFFLRRPPPFPFSPVIFSGLIDLVLASDNRYKLPKFGLSPLNSCAWTHIPVKIKWFLFS